MPTSTESVSTPLPDGDAPVFADKDITITRDSVTTGGAVYPMTDISDTQVTDREPIWQCFAGLGCFIASFVIFYRHGQHVTWPSRIFFLAAVGFSYWYNQNKAWLILVLPDKRLKVLRAKDRGYLKKLKGLIAQAKAPAA